MLPVENPDCGVTPRSRSLLSCAPGLVVWALSVFVLALVWDDDYVVFLGKGPGARN